LPDENGPKSPSPEELEAAVSERTIPAESKHKRYVVFSK
jgi:hypothetical protein